VCENRVLRRIFGTEREREKERRLREAGEDYIMRSFITCTFHKIF